MCSLAHAALFKRTAGASSACRSRPPSVFRRAAPRPLASAPHAAVKPPDHLLKYFKNLDEEQQKVAFRKFDAAGFAAPACEDLLGYLTDEKLEEIGIESMAVRAQLLRAIAESGPSKEVVLVDRHGTTEKLEITESGFDLWAASTMIKRLLGDGRVKYIGTWEELENNAVYQVSGTLHKPVDVLEQDKQADKDVKEEVVAAALADMRALHQEEAWRLSKMEQCRGLDKVKLKHHGLNLERECDDIIVTPNCCKVVKVADEVDVDVVKPLNHVLALIKWGVKDHETDFEFARRKDGSPKELQAALGGIRVVSDKHQAATLKQQLSQKHVDLYLRCGSRFTLCPVEDAAASTQ